MYRPANNATPRTPKAKASSSSLLAAFKALTGTKSRVPPSSPSTTATTTFPLFPPGGASTSARHSSRPGGGGGPRNGSFDRPPAPTASKISGGPDRLEALLDQLHDGNRPAVRAKAAAEVAQIIKLYPVSNVVDVWTMARDLIDDDDSPETHTPGYSLLYACVKHKTLTPHERAFFFDAIIPRQEQDPATFGMRFKVLRAITEDARYLDSLEDMIIPLLVRLLRQCYRAAAAARQNASARSAAAGDDAHDLSHGSSAQLKQVLDFVADVIKFNSKLCTREDLKTLVDELLLICHATADPTDKGHAVHIIDSLITYSQLHPENLRAYVEVVAAAYVTAPSIRETVWRAVSHLLHSHHGPATHDALLGILKEPAASPDRVSRAQVDSMRGAVRIYTRIVTSPASEEPLPQTSISKLISACRKSLVADCARLEADVLALALEITQHLDTTALLLEEKRWTNFVDIVVQCSSRPVPARSLSSSSSSTSSAAAAASTNTLQELADYLMTDSQDMDSDSRSRVMELFLRVVPCLDDGTATTLIEYYALEVLLLPSAKEWWSGCNHLLRGVLCDGQRTTAIRRLALKTLHDAYNTGEAFNKDETILLMLAMLARIKTEHDVAVVEELAQFASSAAIWTSSDKTFAQIVETLEDALTHLERRPAADAGPSVSVCVAQALVLIFLRTVTRSAHKAELVFDVALRIAASDQAPTDARLVCLKLLFHLRANTKHAIFVLSTADCDVLADMMCRTERTAPAASSDSAAASRANTLDDSVARRPVLASVSALASHSTASLSRSSTTNANKSSTSLNRACRHPAPMWLYPNRPSFPDEPQNTASRVVYASLGRGGGHPGLPRMAPKVALNISGWLEYLLGALQQPEIDWEMYSFILLHLGPQLTNHALFVDCIPQVKLLRGIVCQQLSNKSFHEPPGFVSLKRDDIALCLYNVLTMLVGYRAHYSKNEEDDMIKMFVLGIGSWERTADTCIHALSVCCHETPLSVTKSVGDILQRMSQIITRGQAAVHILEFLASLARLPELFRNFREDEFRMVFGICFNYLRFVRDRRRLASETHRASSQQLRALGRTGRDSPSPSESDRAAASSSSLADELPQYVYIMTYHVMTFWFISLRLPDRARHMPWIRRNLAQPSLESDGHDVLEEQAQVLIDLMERISYTDRDDTEADAGFATEYDGVVSKKSWVVGTSILTLETAARTGVTQITRRRPSSTKHSYYRPNFTTLPRHQVPSLSGVAVESYHAAEHVSILPDEVLQEFYSPSNIGDAPAPAADAPVPLDDSDMTRRGIAAFDRISPLDGHKAGIIYVGEDHATEADILQNVMGSADYTAFLNRIGTLTELKGARFNTQGLDRDMDLDGKFTFVWRDRVSELVFHVTTMMPTSAEHDPQCVAKKRHIGNDFVNIVFNNSGHPFRFDTFPSEFNYVYIVITPEARASFIDTRLDAADYVSATSSAAGGDGGGPRRADDGPWDHLYYKVYVLTRPGIPQISPAAQTKIVSGASLPAFIRLLTLNASTFSHVWASKESGVEHVSSWRTRLREIKKLRERAMAASDMSAQSSMQQSYGSPSTSGRAMPLGRTTSNNAISSLNLGINPNFAAHSVRESGGILGTSMRAAMHSTAESAVFRRQSANPTVFTLDGNMVASPAVEPAVSPFASNPVPNLNRYSSLSRGSAATDMERSSSQGSGRQ